MIQPNVKISETGVVIDGINLNEKTLKNLDILTENKSQIMSALGAGTLRLLAKNKEQSEVNVDHVEAIADMIEFVEGLSYE